MTYSFSIYFVKRQQISGRISENVLQAFSFTEVFFGIYSRFAMIPGTNIKSVIVKSWRAQVLFVSFLSIFNSTTTSVIEPWLSTIRNR